MEIKEVSEKLLEKGYTLLSKEYKSNKDVLEFSKDGYIYCCSYNCFTRTYNPKKWGISNKYSIQNMNLFLEKNGYTCRIVSKEYNYNDLELRCECGEIYRATFNNILANKSIYCKNCAILKRARFFIKQEKELVFEKYGYKLIEDYTNGTDYLYFIDKDGYYGRASSDSLVSYNGTYLKFSLKNKYTLENVRRFIELNSLNCKLNSTEVFDMRDEKLEFICNCGDIYELSVNTFLSTKKDKCNKCSIKNVSDVRILNMKDYIDSLLKDFELTPMDKINTKTEEVYCIDKNGYYVKTSISAIEDRSNPSSTIFHICNKYVIENIKNYIKINNIDCELLDTEYKGKKQKIKFRCKCGNIFYKRIYDFKSRGNTYCKDCGKINVKSKIELLTKDWLVSNNIENIGEKTFFGCRDKYLLPFDFYLPNHNICIECQGLQHYKAIDYFGGIDRYNYTVKHDEMKKNYCINNNIKYLELSYLDFKDNTYIEKLENNINKLR